MEHRRWLGIRATTAGLIPHLVMLLTVATWSANATVMKVGLRYVDPTSFTAARFLIGASFSWVLSIAVNRRAAFDMPPRRVPLAAVIGLGVNQICFSFGLSLTSVVDASLIQGLTPIVAATFVVIATHRRVRHSEAAALAIGFAGVALIVSAARSQGGGSSVGDLVILATPLTWAFFLTFALSDARRMSATRIAPWVLTAPLIVLLPVGCLGITSSGGDWWHALPALLTAGLAASSLAYTASLWCLPRLGVTATAIYSYFQPPLGAGIAALFLHEPYRPIQLVGTLLILTAAYLGRSKGGMSAAGPVRSRTKSE